MRHFLNQGSRTPVDCQAILLPPPANTNGRSTHNDAQPTYPDYAVAETAILKVFPCRSTAQAMRASLLASATTAAFLCILAVKPRSHAPNEVGL